MSALTAFAGFRKDKKLKLDEAARLLGVDRTTILRWERGNPLIPAKRLKQIEEVTGISRRDLRPDIFGTVGARETKSRDGARPKKMAANPKVAAGAI